MKQRVYINCTYITNQTGRRGITTLFTFCHLLFVLLLLAGACRNQTENNVQHRSTENKAKEKQGRKERKPPASRYTCPMHPEVNQEGPGQCPICGMDLVKTSPQEKEVITEGDRTGTKAGANEITLEMLLRPANEFVVSSLAVTAMKKKEQVLEISTPGTVEYDNRATGSIASRVNGRIEKLYVRYQYQPVRKGQKIMDIYSPELLTAQQNLIFLLKNDPGNGSLIQAARERLLLLGMSGAQLQKVIQSKTPQYSTPVYSNYSGHLHSAAGGAMPGVRSPLLPSGAMGETSFTSQPISLKEGMYVQKGQNLFTVYDPSRAWVLLSIYADWQQLVKEGQPVTIVPASGPSRTFRGKIGYMEPFYRKNSRTVAARVYFDNSGMHLPIGSQVQATVLAPAKMVNWLPKEAVYSLGYDQIVFRKEPFGFRAKKITTGITVSNAIQVLSGLAVTDSVAVNARFLTDSESFIKTTP